MDYSSKHEFGSYPSQFKDYESSQIVILPVPFDLTSSWLKGADKAPGAVFDASEHLELFDIETRSEVYRKGIHTLDPIVENDVSSMVREVNGKVLSLIRSGKFVVTLGGEHSVSIGAACAHADAFGDISVLQLDAHTDLRDEYLGSRFNHGCTMARIREKAANCVSVGIRSMDSSELNAANAASVFFAHEIPYRKKWIRDVINCLGKKVYVTIDLDCFENGIMSSTGTPEPGGLSWYDVMSLLKAVSTRRSVVGFDVAELCPSENRAPDFLTAKLIYQFLSYIFFYRRD